MELIHPLASIDVESTGTDIVKDRVVSLSIRTLSSYDGKAEALDFVLNPEMLMTDEVIEIHGISNEFAAQCPVFKDKARFIYAALTGCDLIGFNLLNFDVPILWEEFYRAGFEWNLDKVKIVDVGNIFKIKEPRTLSAAVKFYCGHEHGEAHSAGADTEANLEVFMGQLMRYPDLNAMDLETLAKFSQYDEPRVDYAGKIGRDKEGCPIYKFGKNKGVRVQDDPGFAQWMLRNDFPQQTKMVLKQLLGMEEKELF